MRAQIDILYGVDLAMCQGGEGNKHLRGKGEVNAQSLACLKT